MVQVGHRVSVFDSQPGGPEFDSVDGLDYFIKKLKNYLKVLMISI
jgi:hypothetical protein